MGLLRRLVLGAALCINHVFSQSATTPSVPTGTPIAANYTGPLRPQIHYSPPTNFMNDPNGMFVDANGTWHLYYQCMIRLKKVHEHYRTDY